MEPAMATAARDSDELRQSKDMAHKAIQKIHSDAEYELKRLVWISELRRDHGLGQGLLKFQFPLRDALSTREKILWWIFKLVSWVLLGVWLWFVLFVVRTPAPNFLVFLSWMFLLGSLLY